MVTVYQVRKTSFGNSEPFLGSTGCPNQYLADRDSTLTSLLAGLGGFPLMLCTTPPKTVVPSCVKNRKTIIESAAQ